ncbi:uncharacterized protein LOC131161547 isoform X1 [Malania oleifera]|uniref:uncharacterized protein LOC131161547 isoform X1 n=1 Tax=Malania oleifera TaxID=397392 RepID=UPI0025AE381E|nr:uncharacterized protein LOC131161547 isoform X1 [Malania oleifera]
MAVAVAQPQHGIQIVSCPKCRYQYELVSGDIVIIKSQKISMDVPAWERTLNFLQMMRESSAAAVHFVVDGQRNVFLLLTYSIMINASMVGFLKGQRDDSLILAHAAKSIKYSLHLFYKMTSLRSNSTKFRLFYSRMTNNKAKKIDTS